MADQVEDFWVVLPSSSNMLSNPTNMPADYTVKLRRPIELTQNDWEVAILNVQYPYNWYNFTKDIQLIFVHYSVTVPVRLPSGEPVELLFPVAEPGKGSLVYGPSLSASVLGAERLTKAIVTVPRGNYDTIQNLCEKICALFTSANKTPSTQLTFVYDVETRMCKFTVSNGTVAFLCDDEYLGSVLGLETRRVDASLLGTALPAKVYQLTLSSTRAAALSSTDAIYVYADIAKYQAVGDEEAPLLGIIPVIGRLGDRNHWSFNPLIYMGVNKTHISEIRMKLRTEAGEPVPFPRESPSVICCLRFRRRKSTI
jgi:hypothetical protein